MKTNIELLYDFLPTRNPVKILLHSFPAKTPQLLPKFHFGDRGFLEISHLLLAVNEVKEALDAADSGTTNRNSEQLGCGGDVLG
jgi:hypothetical protein